MTTTTTKNISIGGLIAVAAIAFGFINYGVPGLAGFVRLQEQNKVFWGTRTEQKVYVEERTYKVVCPIWKEQNLFGKYVTYRDRTWCKDYVDRL
jgi:hypothetical protein